MIFVFVSWDSAWFGWFGDFFLFRGILRGLGGLVIFFVSWNSAVVWVVW